MHVFDLQQICVRIEELSSPGSSHWKNLQMSVETEREREDLNLDSNDSVNGTQSRMIESLNNYITFVLCTFEPRWRFQVVISTNITVA